VNAKREEKEETDLREETEEREEREGTEETEEIVRREEDRTEEAEADVMNERISSHSDIIHSIKIST